MSKPVCDLSAVFVGEESLVVRCASAWRQEGFRVVALVSDVPHVRRSATKEELPLIGHEEFGSLTEEYDYLFSVVNSKILDDTALGLASRGAVNFHDSPLPAYAGVNATSWAILNREPSHGITWHVMVEEIDAGPVLEQRIFPLRDDDTALTVNARCFDTALEAFRDLIGRLRAAPPTGTAQDLSQRSYYGQWKRPRAAATIDWNDSGDQIGALIRALDFDPYPNPLGRPKILLGDEVVVVEEADFTPSEGAPAPGSLIGVDGSWLTVACRDGAVRARLATPAGAPFVAPWSNRARPRSLPCLSDDDARTLTALAEELARHEAFWTTQLTRADPLELPTATIPPGDDTSAVDTPGGLAHLADLPTDHVAAAAVIAHLRRLTDRDSFSISVRGPAQLLPEPASLYFAAEVPLTVDAPLDEPFESFAATISERLDQIARRRTYAADLLTRTPALSELDAPHHPIVIEFGAIGEPKPLPEAVTIRISPDGTSVEMIGASRGPTSVGIARMTDQLRLLLEGAAIEPGTPIGDLPLISSDERMLLLETWAGRAAGTATTLIDPFRSVVSAMPERVAVIAGSESVTFGALDAWSDTVAHNLGDEDVGPGDVVGIKLERGAPAIAIMLGVLKAGAAYLPIDSSLPPERVDHMLRDAGVRLVIAEEPGTRTQDAHDEIDGPGVRQLPHTALGRPPNDTGTLPAVTSDDLAYILYTSGSTGTPKGVCVPHGALANHATAMASEFGLGPGERVLQFASLSFDVAAEEIFPTLLAGATVVVRDSDVASSIEALEAFIDSHRISVVNLPAGFWSTWAHDLALRDQPALPSCLRLVVTGSERVNAADLRIWSESVGDSVRWLNAYGPTETTITATVFDPCDSAEIEGTSVPIGRPVSGVTARVLDERGALVPVGTAGEICIGGSGLALGYRNLPELTAQKFGPDPYTDRAVLYRTGDMGRWRTDGTIEFLGRTDDQVKVRGFRIELGEIESKLSGIEGVAQAAVVARPDHVGHQALAAFVVRDSRTDLSVTELRDRLAQQLPPYMVPSALAWIEELPMTPTGKVDRRALPEVTLEERSSATHVAPRTPLEEQLAESWGRVLEIDRVGVHDNFFDLGGNSLSAIRLFSEITAVTGQRIGLADLFAAPTIGDLAAYLGNDPARSATQRERLPSWVFPIKESGTRPPLFHLGGASVLRNLAHYLPDDQPLYALLEQDLEADHFATSVEEIVPHCLEGLRAVQPHGPYLIAGLCFGGVVALEMSRQLEQEGEEIALTLMIDSFAPGSTAQRITAATGADESGPPRRSLDRILRRYRPSRVIRKLQRRTWRRIWGPLHEFYRRMDRSMPSWLRDVEEANTIASDAYRPTPYDGDVTLFIATHKDERLEYAPLNGWGPFISGRLDTAEVVGGHVSVYDEPHVANLAAELNARLEALPDKNPSSTPSSRGPAGSEPA